MVYLNLNGHLLYLFRCKNRPLIRAIHHVTIQIINLLSYHDQNHDTKNRTKNKIQLDITTFYQFNAPKIPFLSKAIRDLSSLLNLNGPNYNLSQDKKEFFGTSNESVFSELLSTTIAIGDAMRLTF